MKYKNKRKKCVNYLVENVKVGVGYYRFEATEFHQLKEMLLAVDKTKKKKQSDYDKGFTAGVSTVARAIGRENAFDAKLFKGNYYLKQPDGTYFSINSLSEYKDET